MYVAGPTDFFRYLWSVSEGVIVKTQTAYAFDLINNCRVQAAHGNISHRKVCSPKTRCNPWIPETLMDGYMGYDQARNSRVKYSERMKFQTCHPLYLCKQVHIRSGGVGRTGDWWEMCRWVMGSWDIVGENSWWAKKAGVKKTAPHNNAWRRKGNNMINGMAACTLVWYDVSPHEYDNLWCTGHVYLMYIENQDF
jgi:hypothetical protein